MGNMKSFLERHGVVDEKEPHKPTDERQCFAHGCPAYPTIYQGGEWSCRWHHRRGGPLLQHITRQLRFHEPLVKWHDKLFCSTVVDFDMGEIAKNAPTQYAPHEGEKYTAYKHRVRQMVEQALYTIPEK